MKEITYYCTSPRETECKQLVCYTVELIEGTDYELRPCLYLKRTISNE